MFKKKYRIVNSKFFKQQNAAIHFDLGELCDYFH